MLFLTTNVILEMNKFKIVLDKKVNMQTCIAEQQGKSHKMVNSYPRNFRHPRLESMNNISNLLNLHIVEFIVSSKRK